MVCVAGLLGGSALGETLTAISERYGWIMTGLSTAGGMMRFVGFAILLRIMLSNDLWEFTSQDLLLQQLLDIFLNFLVQHCY
ncbi:MAG: PTS sugar transporter subunit IIC [Roseburia inulinivorans]